MDILLMILRTFLLPLLMHGVEVMVSEKGSGEKKKEIVMDTAKTILVGWESMSKGGQKETADKYAPIISDLIDAAVPDLFPKEEELGKI